jgi:multiple sugar transport system substrate-binding protein
MRYRRALALLLILTLLSGCSLGAPDAATNPTTQSDSASAVPAVATTSSEPAAASSGDVITIGFAASEYERSTYEPLMATFSQQNPGIRVQFVSLDEAFQSANNGQGVDFGKLVRQVASAADTATLSFVRPEDLQAGLLRDLKPLVDADPTFNANDFYPGVFDAGSLNGGTYMLPRSVQIQLLAYNKDLWAARGLASPPPNWSWSDLIGDAEQLAQKRGDQVDVYGMIDWEGRMLPLFGDLAASGIDLFATPASQVRLDQPAIAASIDRVAALAQSGAIYLKPRDPNTAPDFEEFRRLILDQHVAIWPREMLQSGPEDSEAPKFAVGVAPYPPVQLPFFGNTEGYVMSSGTQHPDAAWRWLSFLSQQQLSQPFGDAGNSSQVPARISIAERSGYWSKLDPETAAAMKAAIGRHTAPPPADPLSGNLLGPLNTALNAVVSGKQKSDQALRDAQSQLDQQLAEAQSTPQPSPESGPVVVSTPVVEVAPEGTTTITFGAFDYEADQLRSLIKTFNQNNRDLFVQLKKIEPTNGTLRMNDVAGNFDCFSWYGPPQNDEITATLDLQPLIDADASFNLADYPPLLLAPFRQAGALHGLPSAVTFRVLTYNKTAFDAAGLSYPTADWTTDDLLNAAQKLTTTSGSTKQYGFASVGSPAQDLLFFLERFGASPTRGSGDQVAPNFTDPKVVEATRFYLDLLRNYSPNKELQGYKYITSFGAEFFDLLTRGQIGMWFGEGDRFFSSSTNAASFTTAIAPPPLGKGPLAPEDINASGLFISARTQQAQACWQWLSYLSQSAVALGANNGFPARSSIAASDAFLNKATPGAAEVYQAYRAALDRSGANPSREPFYRSKLDYFWFFRAADRALQGKDLERELADAQTLTEQFMACIQGGAQASACATQVDPTYEGLNRAQTGQK